VSARTGEGLDKLLELVERDLPRPAVKITALVPYNRGDLVARIHNEGEVNAVDHLPTGSLVRARVPGALAAELDQYTPTEARL
jgi:GTP-binding protein HflX